MGPPAVVDAAGADVVDAHPMALMANEMMKRRFMRAAVTGGKRRWGAALAPALCWRRFYHGLIGIFGASHARWVIRARESSRRDRVFLNVRIILITFRSRPERSWAESKERSRS